MSSALPNIFYLDDPQDGASAYLLTEVGVTVAAISVDAAASSAAALPHFSCEHTLAVDVSYAVRNGDVGSLLVDVRDSADAWLRIIVFAGESVRVSAGRSRRVRFADSAEAPWARALRVSEAAGGEALYPRSPSWARSTVPALGLHIAARLRAPVRAAAELIVTPALTTLEALVSAGYAPRFSTAEAEADFDVPFFSRPGQNGHARALVAELCASFYTLGWVTGTGGSISIRIGNRIFMAPSGVQKERMQPADIYVLDGAGGEIYEPRPLPGRPALKLSQCAPLFQHAFSLRNAGAAIHTHDINAVLVTLLAGTGTEFRITHQEMIKGIAGHGFLDELVVPIIENTPHEADLADSLGEAMRKYPRSNAVLVRRHGVYVWGANWEAAKAQAECYHYLFEAAVRMTAIGVDPAVAPARIADGIGAARAYGSGAERVTSYDKSGASSAPHNSAKHTGSCCESGAAEGWHGSAGTSALPAPPSADREANAPLPLPPRDSYSTLLLDIEGCTTSLSFVTDTLFPYAAAHTRAWLVARWSGDDMEEARDDVTALEVLSAADVASGADGAAASSVPSGAGSSWGCGKNVDNALVDAICANVAWQMASNRKSGALKALQGHVWRDGYTKGTLNGHVYADVPVALRAWLEAGKRTYIYSSGSREAQRLLFKHSVAGDLRPLLSGYFDTAVGGKLVASSYADILLSLGEDKPSRVLFATDSLGEAAAAAAAGLQVVVTVRPGNNALPTGGIAWPTVESLTEL